MKIKDAGAIDVMDDGNWTVLAETAAGECYLLNHLWQEGSDPDAEARAEALARRVLERGWIDLDHWTFHRTVYGSPAFEAEEREAAMYAQELRQGAGSEEMIPHNIRTLL